MKLTGYWQIPKSSAMVEAELYLGESEYRIATSERGFQTASTEGITVSDRIGSIPRKIILPDGSLFETKDNDQVDAWLKQYKSDKNLLHTLESNLAIVFGSLLLTVLIIAGGYQYGLPLTAKTLAHLVPDKVLDHISQETMELLDDNLLQSSSLSLEQQQQVQQSFDRLIKQLGYNPDQFQIGFRHMSYDQLFDDKLSNDNLSKDKKEKKHQSLDNHQSSESARLENLEKNNPQIVDNEELVDCEGLVNAFALPSGQIIFTDDLVKLAANQQELDAILLHEIAHVTEQHAMQQVIRSTIITVILAVFVGDIGAMEEFVVGTSTFLTTAQYSRKFEAEADRIALEQMTKANIDPIHFAYIMAKLTHEELRDVPQAELKAKMEELILNDQGSWFELVSTHPDEVKRIKAALIAHQQLSR